MKKGVKVVLILTTLVVLGVGGYFGFKEVEKYNLDKLKGEFEKKLKALELKNSVASENALNDPLAATKQIIKSEDGTELIMIDTETEEVIGITPIDDGNNMPFPMEQQDGLLGAYTEYDNVKVLQTFLLFANPDLVLVGGIDGKFGASTAAAVKQETEGFADQAFNALYDGLSTELENDVPIEDETIVGELFGEYGYDAITNEDGSWDYVAMAKVYETVTKQYYDEVVKPEFDYFTSL